MKKTFLIIVLAAIVVLVAYEGLILYDNNFRYGRMWETPAVHPLEQPVLATPEGVIPIGGRDEILKHTPPERIRPPLEMDDPQTVSMGKSLYFTYCAQCHGEFFDGNGTVGQSFNPPLPDLMGPKVQSLPQGLMFKEISYGKQDGRQPPLATTIALMDRWRIIAFVQSLGTRQGTPQVTQR